MARINRIVLIFMQICGRKIIYRKYFLASIVLRLLQLAEFFHEALGADCGVDLGHERQLRLAAVAGRDCAAVNENGILLKPRMTAERN